MQTFIRWSDQLAAAKLAADYRRGRGARRHCVDECVRLVFIIARADSRNLLPNRDSEHPPD